MLEGNLYNDNEFLEKEKSSSMKKLPYYCLLNENNFQKDDYFNGKHYNILQKLN